MKNEKIEKIRKEIENCEKCKLHETRINTVLGEGNLDSKIMFISEAPGRWEDQKGVPFVGRAGDILNELLDSIGLKREDVYICNILKCRPPNNRDPLIDEMNLCTPFLDRQIEIIKPKIIAVMGRISMNYIFKKFNLEIPQISKIHGETFKMNNLLGIRHIIALYHPAAATYNPNLKTVLLEDFKKIRKILS